MAKGEGREEAIQLLPVIFGPMPAKKKQCCGSGSGFRIMDPQLRIRKKYLRIHNTGGKLDSPHLGFSGRSKEEVCRMPASSGGGGGMQRGLGPSANSPLNQINTTFTKRGLGEWI
jgi:hypothetical protein